jgi:hypothetical protein
MDRIIWLSLALIVALVAFGIVAGTLRGRVGVDQTPRRCPHCETPMSMRRVPLAQALTFRGVWMRPHCGTRLKRRWRVEGSAA